jgi:hypothetical protein
MTDTEYDPLMESLVRKRELLLENLASCHDPVDQGQ